MKKLLILILFFTACSDVRSADKANQPKETEQSFLKNHAKFLTVGATTLVGAYTILWQLYKDDQSIKAEGNELFYIDLYSEEELPFILAKNQRFMEWCKNHPKLVLRVTAAVLGSSFLVYTVGEKMYTMVKPAEQKIPSASPDLSSKQPIKLDTIPEEDQEQPTTISEPQKNDPLIVTPARPTGPTASSPATVQSIVPPPTPSPSPAPTTRSQPTTSSSTPASPTASSPAPATATATTNGATNNLVTTTNTSSTTKSLTTTGPSSSTNTKKQILMLRIRR
ncbi:MAG: hypothetical protein WCT20_03910 [Candidatus Babeliales bacterium]